MILKRFYIINNNAVFYLVLIVLTILLMLVDIQRQDTSLSFDADTLALAINNANEEVQLELPHPISLYNCSLYYSDRFALGRDTFFNAITTSNHFTSPCYLLSIKLANVLHNNPILFGITDFTLRDRKLWLKYRSSKYSVNKHTPVHKKQ